MERAWFEELPEQTKLVRAMPNLPAMVGEGMTGVVRGVLPVHRP